MRYFSALMAVCLLLLSSPVLAADNDPYAGVESLTEIVGRYVIGPWQGAFVGGQNCQLQNTETLGGVEWSLSALRSTQERSVQLGADFLHDAQFKELTLQLDQNPPVKLSFGKSRFGMFYKATPEMLKQMAAARFATYSIGTGSVGAGSVSFDLRGFSQAYALFEKCLNDRLPARLPNQPLVESDARVITGAPTWQMIELSYEGKPYERLANLNQPADYALGLWVHNRAQYVLSLTVTKGDLPSFPFPRQAELLLDSGKKLTLPYIVQADGILISLPIAQVREIAKSRTLGISAGPVKIFYNINGFTQAAQAIQFTD